MSKRRNTLQSSSPPSTLDLERYSRGLADRKRWARAGKDNPHRRAEDATPKSSLLRTAQNLIISTTLSSPSVAQQVSLLRAIDKTSQVNITILLSVGATLGDVTVDLSELVHLSDANYSIAVESLIFADRLFLAPDEDIQTVRHLHSSFVVDLANEHGSGTIGPFGKVVGMLAAEPRQINQIEELWHFVTEQKRQYVEILGPDIFSVIQALCDCQALTTWHFLDRSLHIMERWALHNTYLALLLLRLYRPSESESSYARKLLLERKHSLPASYVRTAIGILDSNFRLNPARPRNGTYFQDHIWLCYQICKAIDSANPIALCDYIVRLYQLDPSACNFLRWDAILKLLRNFQPDIRSTFITYLMNGQMVRTQYPLVAMATGKGAFLADIVSVMDSNRRRNPVDALFKIVRQLPSRAAAALAQSLLDRSTVERLVSVLQRKNAKRPQPYSHRSSILRVPVLRLEALNVARQLDLITDEDAFKEQQSELAQLRILYFQSEMRAGRVRIDRSALIAAIDQNDHFPLHTLESAAKTWSSDDRKAFLPSLVSYVSSEVTKHLLYNCEANFDLALSNHLRHGVVVPRILRAFEDALQTVTPRSYLHQLAGNNMTSVERNAEVISALRESTGHAAKQFVDRWLTIEPGGDFENELASKISARIGKELSKSRRQRVALARSIYGEAIFALRKLLSDARRFLKDSLTKEIIGRLQQLRTVAKHDARSKDGSRELIDILETNLHQALDEVGAWLGPSFGSGVEIAFRLEELVGLHLLSSTLSAWDKLNVKTACFRRKDDAWVKGDFSIAPQYRTMFQEIVHNLLSNAFKYSGENLKTRVTLSLRAGDHGASILCTNSIAPSRLDDVVGERDSTIRKAQQQNIDKAREDHESGFQKIRSAVRSRVLSDPSIDISPVDLKTRTFSIQITIPNVSDLIVE